MPPAMIPLRICAFKFLRVAALVFVCSLTASAGLGQEAGTTDAASLPLITLDEYLNTTDITGARISPDGASAVIGTDSPDWKANTYRHTLWLWTPQGGLRALTQSGSDEDAEWSPDGQWIAFVSDRPLPGAADDSEIEEAETADGASGPRSNPRARHTDDSVARIWLIPTSGGEAQPLYTEPLDVHGFAWSADGKQIYFSTATPLTPDQEDDQEEKWKDVIRWREQEHGDMILALPVAAALAHTSALPTAHQAADKKADKKADKEEDSEGQESAAKPSSKTSSHRRQKAAGASDDDLPLPPGAKILAKSKLDIEEIAPSPDGTFVAFISDSVSHRMENPEDTEIYLVPGTASGSTPEPARQLTHNQALEAGLRWSPDSHSIYFMVHAASGALGAKYRDVQGRIYRLNVQEALKSPASEKNSPSSENGTDPNIELLGSAFTGSFEDFDIAADGSILAAGIKGTREQMYLVAGQQATQLPGLPGSYSNLSLPKTGSAMLVRKSAINQPTQVYLASDFHQPGQLTPLTTFNPIFAKRAQPEWQPYSWKSPDGATVEGVLIFPPGKKNAKNLRMLTLIHGGPADADGNRFGADWYDWATLAATRGWLVFRPNYRGSTGYGDDFMLGIAPHLVSAPSADILAGVDALVKDGYADPDRLAIGGYSYGGYLTNWIITETTRFKAAVTGAGAVEHAANWGNDDVTWDDAWYLNGRPWESPELYQSEAALFRMNRVKTPTHIVQGSSDVRVSYLEGVTLERALQQLGVPHSFLVFPGEDHSLDRNPWHGYIKLREELKWLDHYDPK